MGALVRVEPQGVDKFDDPDVIAAIKQTIAKGATDAQLRVFVEVCRTTGLNPWLKEIWYVADKGIIMAARDGYLRVANENPAFDGIETRVERDDKKVPIKAVCTVWRKDRSHPTISEAYFNEYKKSSPVWTQYPSAMISKVAEVLALKRSFAINGVVTEEEIGHDGSGSVEAAQAVAQEKIATLKAERDQRQNIVEIQAQTDAPKSEGYQKMMAAFDELEKEFNAIYKNAAYREVLESFSVKTPTDFEDSAEGAKAARKCYKAAGARLQELKHPEPEPIGTEKDPNFGNEWTRAGLPISNLDPTFPGEFSIKVCVEKFAVLKDRMYKAMGPDAGDAEYRRILARYNVKSSNGFRSSGPATKCYTELLEALKQIEGLAL